MVRGKKLVLEKVSVRLIGNKIAYMHADFSVCVTKMAEYMCVHLHSVCCDRAKIKI